MQLVKSRRMRWVEHVACEGDKRGAYSILVGNPERKITVVIRTFKWKENIKMDLHVLE